MKSNARYDIFKLERIKKLVIDSDPALDQSPLLSFKIG